MPHLVYVGLGSNLKNPKAQIRRAIKSLQNLSEVLDLQVSRLYRSKAIGPGDQPDYINAVARFFTQTEPHQLLGILQGIETDQKRVRARRWGPRTLDLDILLYGDSSIHSTTLAIPHPRIMERSFVLLPLSDLDPEMVFPCGTSLREALARVDQTETFPIDRE